MTESPLKNWIPYKLTGNGDQQLCHWLNTFGAPFAEPFFNETILKCIGLNGKHARTGSVSAIDRVNEWADEMEDVEPTAIIFHVSRCGSTLVSQLLAMMEENTVLSEVPFLDDVLRLPFKDSGFDEPAVNSLFTSVLKFYGQKKTGKEERLFIKTDSWHIFFYEQLRRLYPSVPFILMYRRPDEVFASHRKQPGMHTVPGLIEPAIFGFDAANPVYDLDLYLANVLEKYFERCLHIVATDKNTLLVNYNEGPISVIKKIAAFTSTALDAETLKVMEERTRYNAKRPGEVFKEDEGTNIAACLNKVMELYQKLEKYKTQL
jgi:hypothetical protein